MPALASGLAVMRHERLAKPAQLLAGISAYSVNTTTRSVNGTYTPVVGRFSNTGTYVESILWVSLTGGSSPLWTMNGSVTSRNVTLPAGGTPLVIYGIN